MPVVEPKPVSVFFIENHCPDLTAGRYRLTATHSLTAGGATKTSNTTTQESGLNLGQYVFHVRGDRFSLSPGSVRKVFPPDGAKGEFAGALPHVILTRDTLPWERELVANDNTASWLAVLVLDADDPNAKITTGKVSDLQSISSIVGYATSISDWVSGEEQKPDTACRYIDLPAVLFNAIAPSMADLRWLAHVRHVAHDDKSVAELATVMAGRFPQPGRKSIAVLVSLEGLGNYLPKSDGTPALDELKHPRVPATSSVRLIVLKDWSFTAVTEKVTFSMLVRGLNQNGTADPLLRLPSAFLNKTSPAEALDAGYIALSHRTRTGYSTISWYRGPLAPAAVSVSGEVGLPVDDADEITFFDTKSGMLNASYAAAWQIGRLLALADQDFSTKLYTWKRQCRSLACQKLQEKTPAAGQRATYAAARQKMLSDDSKTGEIFAALGSLATPDKIPTTTLNGDIGETDSSIVLKDASDYSASGVIRIDDEIISYTSKSGNTLSVSGGRGADGTKATAHLKGASVGPVEFLLPPAVKLWLADLALFHRVPFHYLVPDEGMLPTESLRFFTVDATWRRALLDGAFSIGRASWQEFDKVYGEAVYEAAEATTGMTGGTVTGVLLRSGLVSGWWPGLIFEAFSDADKTDDTTKLDHVRLERLAPDVVILLVNGEMKCLKIHEPPEGLHFGLGVLAYQDGAVASWQKDLRDLDLSDMKKYGRVKSPAVTLDGSSLPFRSGLPGVLKVDQLATVIQGKCSAATFTAAEFALSMIEGVEGGVFKSNGS